MQLAERIKRVLAVVILICFFLPLAQCSSKEPAGTEQKENRPAPQVLVPADSVKFESLDEVPLVAMYIWPLLFIGVRSKAKSRCSIALVGVTEAVIGGGVLWCVLQTIGLWGTVRYGGVILVFAHVAYLAAVTITLYGCVREPSNHSLQTRRP